MMGGSVVKSINLGSQITCVQILAPPLTSYDLGQITQLLCVALLMDNNKPISYNTSALSFLLLRLGLMGVMKNELRQNIARKR